MLNVLKVPKCINTNEHIGRNLEEIYPIKEWLFQNKDDSVTVPSMDKVDVVITVLAMQSHTCIVDDARHPIEGHIDFREVDCQEHTSSR